MRIRTVEELRAVIDDLDDDMPVRCIFDSGFGGGEGDASVQPDRSGVPTLWIDADQG